MFDHVTLLHDFSCLRILTMILTITQMIALCSHDYLRLQVSQHTPTYTLMINLLEYLMGL